MFSSDLDSRLAAWSSLRKAIDQCEEPLLEVIDFWNQAPLIPHNHQIDPFYPGSWPNPWEILERNVYDDFTKAIMIGYTLLLTETFKNSSIQIRTLVDKQHNKLYNAVYINELCVLNFCDDGVVAASQIPDCCQVENLVLLERPR